MNNKSTQELRALIRRHKRWDLLFGLLGLLALSVGILTLLALFVDMAVAGIPRLTAEFFTAFPSRRASQAGILSAWVGSALVMAVTALVAVLWLRERASSLRWLGIALSVGGVLIVFLGSGSDGGQSSLFGNFLMFASVVCWGLYTALAKRVAGFDSLVITTAVTGTGALLLSPLAGYEIVTANLAGDGLPPLPLIGWVELLYLGAIASGMAYLLYNASLRHLDASEVGVYTNLIPIVGVLTGVVVLGEPLSTRAIVGGLVVMLGVWITSRSERPVAVTA